MGFSACLPGVSGLTQVHPFVLTGLRPAPVLFLYFSFPHLTNLEDARPLVFESRGINPLATGLVPLHLPVRFANLRSGLEFAAKSARFPRL